MIILRVTPCWNFVASPTVLQTHYKNSRNACFFTSFSHKIRYKDVNKLYCWYIFTSWNIWWCLFIIPERGLLVFSSKFILLQTFPSDINAVYSLDSPMCSRSKSRNSLRLLLFPYLFVFISTLVCLYFHICLLLIPYSANKSVLINIFPVPFRGKVRVMSSIK